VKLEIMINIKIQTGLRSNKEHEAIPIPRDASTKVCKAFFGRRETLKARTGGSRRTLARAYPPDIACIQTLTK
jgi:hypothetical protein